METHLTSLYSIDKNQSEILKLNIDTFINFYLLVVNMGIWNRSKIDLPYLTRPRQFPEQDSRCSPGHRQTNELLILSDRRTRFRPHCPIRRTGVKLQLGEPSLDLMNQVIRPGRVEDSHPQHTHHRDCTYGLRPHIVLLVSDRAPACFSTTYLTTESPAII